MAIWSVSIISILMVALALSSKTKVPPTHTQTGFYFDAAEFIKLTEKIGEKFPSQADCPAGTVGKMEEELRYKKALNKTFSCSDESANRKVIFTSISNNYITRMTSIFFEKNRPCDPNNLKQLFGIEGSGTANGQFQWQIQNAEAKWAGAAGSELRIFASCDIYTHEFWIGASALAAEVSVLREKGPIFVTSDAFEPSLVNEFRAIAEQKGLLTGRSKRIFESAIQEAKKQ